MDKVELIPAFEWTCDKCGRSHFARVIVPELTDEERREIILENDMNPDEVGDDQLLLVPETVTCNDCGTEYETVEFGQ